MSDLGDLYGEVILDHYKRPQNFRALPDATHKAAGANPLCGDHLYLFLKLEGERIADLGFQGSGCAISRASASIMTQLVKGKGRAEAEELFRKFHAMVTREAGTPVDAEALGKMAVFAGVAEFPVRVKCATLAWHTLEAALKGGGTVSTE
jgi:nitrogen fixation NifU-like protein